MLAPLSWLKDYIDITLPVEKLAIRLTEIGLSVEKILNISGETVFEIEITPNRADLMSIIGIAREIAAIENKKIKITEIILPKLSGDLPIKINTDFNLFYRYNGIIVKNIKIESSPSWLQKKNYHDEFKTN